jgi:hypothetical protein
MGSARRTISLIRALALTCASAYTFFYLIFYANRYKFLWPARAPMLTFVGFYWL